jgi:hypothetical protein
MTPEENLVKAVLEQAFIDYHEGMRDLLKARKMIGSSRGKKELRKAEILEFNAELRVKSVERWIKTKPREGMISFGLCCSVVGADPTRMAVGFRSISSWRAFNEKTARAEFESLIRKNERIKRESLAEEIKAA